MGSQASVAGASSQLKVLVTGAGGFVGRHLMANLRGNHPDWVLDAPTWNSDGKGLDVTDADAVETWIRDARPDMLVHLAAVSAVTTSVRDPRLTWQVNLSGTLNVVLALQRHAPETHLLFVSSAEVYGDSIRADAPATEAMLLEPVNPYAASKAAADILVRQAASGGLPATVMRPFNHTGQGQSDAFVAPSFAGQIARIEAGLQQPVIEVGSLDDERDFLDVADVTEAYRLILERRKDSATHGVFNVASGTAIRIGDLLDRLLSMSPVKIEVRVDDNRLRTAPIPRMVGNASRLRALGWAPSHHLDETLAAVLAEQRRAVGLSN